MNADLSWARLLDWDRAFGSTEPEVIDWVVEGFIERRKLIAVYGDMKVGKSLLAQDVAAAVATGRPVLGLPPQRAETVLYLDFENDESLVTDRYRDKMGYTAAELRGRLWYASYPEMPMLDTPEGGRRACELAYWTRAGLIIVDTTSRVIGGSEISNDTFADLARYTLFPLKKAGHTTMRLDHEGKDPVQRAARGQRQRRRYRRAVAHDRDVQRRAADARGV